MASVESEKRALRERIQAAMLALPPAQRALEEEVIQAAIQVDPVWRAARTVLLYKPLAPEFSVVGLTLAAWRQGKRTAFPRIAGPGKLSLHLVTSWSELRPGAHGILEPAADKPELDPKDVDLAVVPGVGWDAEGHRLGRGGGYYDRLIPRLGGPAWGVGFHCQWVQKLPRSDWDAKVARTWISTPDGLV